MTLCNWKPILGIWHFVRLLVNKYFIVDNKWFFFANSLLRLFWNIFQKKKVRDKWWHFCIFPYFLPSLQHSLQNAKCFKIIRVYCRLNLYVVKMGGNHFKHASIICQSLQGNLTFFFAQNSWSSSSSHSKTILANHVFFTAVPPFKKSIFKALIRLVIWQ